MAAILGAAATRALPLCGLGFNIFNDKLSRDSGGKAMSESKISKDQFLLSVVIPVYNETETIEEVSIASSFAPFRKEIIVVDDGSTDGTRQYFERH